MKMGVYSPLFDALNYSDCKIAKIFQGLIPGPHWGGLTAPPPDSPAAQKFFSSLRLSKNRNPPKSLMRHWFLILNGVIENCLHYLFIYVIFFIFYMVY